MPVHGVLDNTVFPWNTSLDTAVPTIGSTLREAGYRSSYIGKWHLTYGPTPPMEAYGYSDWEGNDQHFMGWAGTGVHFDPVIADNAAHWLTENATGLDQPWFLTVALVNPHDVMWYPIDQPDYRAAHPDELESARALLAASKWMDGEVVPAFEDDYAEVVDRLPENFGDDLISKPACHRQWRWDQQHSIWGFIDPDDPRRLAPPPRLLRPPPRAGRRVARPGARRPRGQRGLGRHDRRVHLRPRRHVRVPRPPVQGPLRLRRDHEGARRRQGPGHHRRRAPRPRP